MKKKFILTGTNNDRFRHRYSVKKIEEFKETFIKFMVDLGFEDDKIKSMFWSEKEDGECVTIRVKDLEDLCWHFNNKRYDIDVFFGRFKIILVIRTRERAPMVEHLEKKACWIKPLKIKKLDDKHKIKIPLQKLKIKK